MLERYEFEPVWFWSPNVGVWAPEEGSDPVPPSPEFRFIGRVLGGGAVAEGERTVWRRGPQSRLEEIGMPGRGEVRVVGRGCGKKRARRERRKKEEEKRIAEVVKL